MIGLAVVILLVLVWSAGYAHGRLIGTLNEREQRRHRGRRAATSLQGTSDGFTTTAGSTGNGSRSLRVSLRREAKPW